MAAGVVLHGNRTARIAKSPSCALRLGRFKRRKRTRSHFNLLRLPADARAIAFQFLHFRYGQVSLIYVYHQLSVLAEPAADTNAGMSALDFGCGSAALRLCAVAVALVGCFPFRGLEAALRTGTT